MKIIKNFQTKNLTIKNSKSRKYINSNKISRKALHQACVTLFTGGPHPDFGKLSRVASIFIG